MMKPVCSALEHGVIILRDADDEPVNNASADYPFATLAPSKGQHLHCWRCSSLVTHPFSFGRCKTCLSQ